jgi:hypothetical protein
MARIVLTMPTIRSYNKRLEALRSERSSFIDLYRELSDYHLSHRGRFLVADRNKGHKRNTRQYNNTSRMAARTLASGMMAGITSPARPWFKLAAPDPEMNEFTAVKEWLHVVQVTMNRVFSTSNLYNSLHTLYSELGVFGTGSMGVYQDFNNVIWCKPYTVGSYMIGADGRNNIDTFYREYEITVGECVKQFGYDNCSNAVRQMWDTGSIESWIEIVHAVEPNDNRDNNSPLSRDKKYRSVYYEKRSVGNREISNRDTGGSGSDQFLRRSGFDEFPILTPRWDITGEDIYATDCPGMDAIGDTKALQLGEKRKYQALDKLVNPPLQGDANLKTKISKGGLGPNEIVWTDPNSKGLSSIYGNYRPDLGAMMTVNNEAEHRIKRAFYEDLFLMLANSDRRQITAREVAEKQEEKLLMLGPVLERLHTELLDPLIDRTFSILQQSGVLPVPPPELQDKELGVEYVSILAQAQRMVAVGGLERLTGFTAQIASVWPEARHKVDAMQVVDEYAESMGVNPRVVQADDKANQIMQAERQASMAAQAQTQAADMAQTAKIASETDTSGENALTEILQQAGLR